MPEPTAQLRDRMVRFFTAFAILIGLAALILAGIMAIGDWYATESWPERGARGDFWGGHIAAGASFASTLFVIAALLMQSHELALQRKDLRYTRKEMENARAVYEKQERHQERQVEIAEKTAIISRIIQLHKVREEMFTEILRAYSTFQVSSLSALKRVIDEQHPNWSVIRYHGECADAIDDLLRDLLGSPCLDSSERVHLKTLTGIDIIAWRHPYSSVDQSGDN